MILVFNSIKQPEFISGLSTLIKQHNLTLIFSCGSLSALMSL